MGWQVFLASVAFMIGGIIQGLVALNHPDFNFAAWHTTVFTIGIQTIAVLFNTVFATRLPYVQSCALAIHIIGFFVIFVPLWALAPKSKAADVLLSFTNNGGWPTTGLSAMIGLQAPLSSLIGYDCSVHMCRSIY